MMAVETKRARDLALALTQTSEAPRFGRLAFRTPRKIFATLELAGRDLNLVFDPELRDFYCEQRYMPPPPFQVVGDATAQRDANLLW